MITTTVIHTPGFGSSSGQVSYTRTDSYNNVHVTRNGDNYTFTFPVDSCRSCWIGGEVYAWSSYNAWASFTFTDPWWTQGSDKRWSITTDVASSISANPGSLNITINDRDNKPLQSFVAIPGNLDNSMLENGDYAYTAIPIIFTQLRNYIYFDSIFDSINYTLSAFFASTALEQNISEGIKLLLQQFVSKKITLEEFNLLVKQSNEEFASEYGTIYINNYNKINLAIEQYKYLLRLKI